MVDTIFAQATGKGTAGVAIIRLSGPCAVAALTSLTRKPPPPPRRAVLRALYEPDGRLLDHALVLYFPRPHSFTGEENVELHLHGGAAVIAGVAEALILLPRLRPAEPGEFSRRAFINGRMDLVEAEGLADLVAADTAEQRRQALRQLGGEMSIQLAVWRQDLIQIAALLEAAIDFSEEDLPADLIEQLKFLFERMDQAIAAQLVDQQRGERLRNGLQVALLGAPNVGKSSLLNRLVCRDAAIVAATAGTTRDVIEVALDLAGWPVVVADTAGLRATKDWVEAEGVRRSQACAAQADLRLLIFDSTQLKSNLSQETIASAREAGFDAATLELVGPESLIICNKIDQVGEKIPTHLFGLPVLGISARTGDGLEALLSVLTEAAAARLDSGGVSRLTRSRHRAALIACQEALFAARQVADLGGHFSLVAPELVAENIRQALRALGRITGTVDVEDILDSVFKQFCIGK